jgi:hypothetical protein
MMDGVLSIKTNFKKLFGYTTRDKTAPHWLRRGIASFQAQKTRCTNKNSDHYKNYGAIGITVDYTVAELCFWLKDNWKATHTKLKNKGVEIHVGRKDHKKPYSLKNIELTTIHENSAERCLRLNTPVPRVAVKKVERKTGKIVAVYASKFEAAEKEGVTAPAIHFRVKAGKGACLYGSQIRTPSKFYFERVTLVP